jgi:hypothetical protein
MTKMKTKLGRRKGYEEQLDLEDAIARKKKKRSVMTPVGMLGAFEDAGLTIGTFYNPDDDKITLETFDGCLRIDEHALEEAVQEQPDLMFRVSRKLALQISRRDAAKTYLATVEAQVDAWLRRGARNSEVKLTEGDVKAQIRVNSNVVRATDQLLRMEHSVREWQALKESVVARGHALREMVTLCSLNYWADPSKGAGVRGMKDRDADTARRAMNRQRRGVD